MNHKTIVSTVLGLIPFLFDGNDDVFWFAFAVGVIGGMVFSIIALALFMPVFFDWGKEQALVKAETVTNNDLNTI